MKVNFWFRKFLSRNLVFSFLISTTLLPSCSWITSRRTLFGDDNKKPSGTKISRETTTVSREQYEDLLTKYQNLLQKTRKGPGSEQLESSPQVDSQEKLSMVDSKDVINDIGKIENSDDIEQGDLGGTVDVFEDTTKKPEEDQFNVGSEGEAMSPGTPNEDIASLDILDQIDILTKAQGLLGEEKYDATLEELKKIENSEHKQVRVRVKYLLGELLFNQKEYDLAMQIFEEVIHQEAFSGIVIKALERLISCSENLKLEKKKKKYHSILHDFFES